MTIRRAERITGLKIHLTIHLSDESEPLVPVFKYTAYDDDGQVVSISTRRVSSDALDSLVHQVYQIRSKEVFERQEWRCATCHGIKPLQIDHVIPRARGRDDRTSNLQGLCPACHEKKHGH